MVDGDWQFLADGWLERTTLWEIMAAAFMYEAAPAADRKEDEGDASDPGGPGR